MATQALPHDQHICYVQCIFCNTILVVCVPGNSLANNSIVTVKCGHCSSLLSVNMGALLQTLTFHDHFQKQNMASHRGKRMEHGSPSKSTRPSFLYTMPKDQKQMLQPPPEKRQRVPSMYNRFIKEEIQRIKANNPDISHREAFSTAAKNWAHLPHIHFGLTLDSNKQKETDEAIMAAPASQQLDHENFF
ncbi:axial regulator YABBY 5-like [Zingiber officinale]|uniref:Uncharacterized protein n=1 Tax=Zingiber officinale TaxID=94328 RepID=A0A8J5FKW7_ZINOF|nr:axial regulator YABBY 5-like [Zingiber officinale]KAG6489598.1 hypothetical protein ZIOFF_050873 [Zingiber officinale]